MNKFLLTLATGVFAFAADAGGSAAQHAQPRTVQTVIYGAGPKWKPGVPPQEQALGGHVAYVAKLFAEKKLIANGPLADGRGLYLYDVDASTAKAIVQVDPGNAEGIIVPLQTGSWTLLFDALDRPVANQSFFVLDYTPGPHWKPGIPLTQQSIGHHVNYMTTLFKEGKVLAGGPVDETHGRYLVAANSKSEADAMIAADPGTIEGIFAATSLQWTPLHH